MVARVCDVPPPACGTEMNSHEILQSFTISEHLQIGSTVSWQQMGSATRSASFCKSKGQRERQMFQRNKLFQGLVAAVMPVAVNLFLMISPVLADPKGKGNSTTFDMVVSAGAAGCLPNATATVTVRQAGQVELMDVSVSGLPRSEEHTSELQSP